MISPKLWFAGVPILLGVFLWQPSPILLLVAVLAAPQLWAAYRQSKEPQADYYKSDKMTRIRYGFQYLALVVFLSVLAFESHEALAVIRRASGH